MNLPAQERTRFADMDKSQLLAEVCVMRAMKEGRVAAPAAPTTPPAASTDPPAWLGTLLTSMDKRTQDSLAAMEKRAQDSEKRA